MTELAGLILIGLIAFASLAWGLWSWTNTKKVKKELVNQEKVLNNKLYEIAILKELGERTGYSLNVEKTVDVITGSLPQFIEYSAVSYMLVEPEKVIFRSHLEESVTRDFVNEVKKRMITSLNALMGKEFKDSQIEETLSGAILIDELEAPVQSFFNIPLVIGDKPVGILTIASKQPGLYKEEEMTILYKITNQASQSVSRLQEVLEVEKGKLNAMVASMAEGVVMTDTDYRIMVINPAVKKMLGIDDKEEATIFTLIDKLGGKLDIRGKLEESVKLDKLIVVDELLLDNKFYQVLISPVKDNLATDEGHSLGGVVLFHDITQEKQAERLREDFTSMMVHELRSPLDGIRKMSELLKTPKVKSDDNTYNEFISLIVKNSTDMLELVGDLLDVAKIEAGKFEILPVPSDIPKLIKERMDYYQVVAQDKGITLSMHADEGLPSIDIDPRRIGQVLNNLLSNAIKFTGKQGTIDILVFKHEKGNDLNAEAHARKWPWWSSKNGPAWKEKSDSIIIAVSDSGSGIPEKHIDQLFNKFQQFEASAKSDQRGTGLGLVIVKGIVEAHKGQMGVGSEDGSGTTFFFGLQLQPETGAQESQPAPKEASSVAAPKGAVKKPAPAAS